MTSLILCRHGRTDWNEKGRYQGQTDVPLNAEGRRQASVLAELLRDERIDAIYASDLARAADTAEAIARLHGLRIVRDSRLREIYQGEWEGMTRAEIQGRYGPLLDRWESTPLEVTLPGGESIADVRRRSFEALREILGRHPWGPICIVTHKVTLTIIRCELTGEPLDPALRRLPPNASFEILEVPASLAPCGADRIPAALPFRGRLD